MAQVTVTVNGRNYTVACDDGEENHLLDLARYVDKHVKELSQSVGQVGDSRLLLMAGLVLADELSEMLARVDELEGEAVRGNGSPNNAAEEIDRAEARAAQALNVAAQRLEDVAGRIEAS